MLITLFSVVRDIQPLGFFFLGRA
ncbi:MAG: hypothetical protein RL592_1622, partial [Verrucomicrobiota bacterium]